MRVLGPLLLLNDTAIERLPSKVSISAMLLTSMEKVGLND